MSRIKTALAKALTNIGRKNGTAFPEQEVQFSNTSNEVAETSMEKEKRLYEYFVSAEAKSYFDKRFKEAKLTCDQFSDFGNVEKYEPGSHFIHDGPVVNVTLNVKRPASRVDTTALRSELRKLGVKQDVIDKAFDASSRENSPARSLIAVSKL